MQFPKSGRGEGWGHRGTRLQLSVAIDSDLPNNVTWTGGSPSGDCGSRIGREPGVDDCANSRDRADRAFWLLERPFFAGFVPGPGDWRASALSEGYWFYYRVAVYSYCRSWRRFRPTLNAARGGMHLMASNKIQRGAWLVHQPFLVHRKRAS